MNRFRSLILALGLAGCTLTTCELFAQQTVTRAQFLANASTRAAFAQGKTTEQFQAAVQALLAGATDAEKQQVANALVALAPSLPPSLQTAIGQAVGQVVVALMATNPSLAQAIQTAVANTPIAALQLSFMGSQVGQAGVAAGAGVVASSNPFSASGSSPR